MESEENEEMGEWGVMEIVRIGDWKNKGTVYGDKRTLAYCIVSFSSLLVLT